jgi:hypothetical protein
MSANHQEQQKQIDNTGRTSKNEKRTKLQEASRQLLVKIRNASSTSLQAMEDTYKTLRHANNTPDAVVRLVFMALPVCLLLLAELSQCNSLILDATVVLSLALTVFKLLPGEIVERHTFLLKVKASPVMKKYEQYNATLQQKTVAAMEACTSFRHDIIGVWLNYEVQELKKDLQHTGLHLSETKRQLARLQEQHKAEQLENSEWQEQQMHHILEETKAEHKHAMKQLQQEHAQALQVMRQEYEQVLEEEAANRVALRQTLEGQETLLNDERRKNRSLRESIDKLEQVSKKEWAETKSLKEQNMTLQREFEMEKQDLEKRYQEAWQKAKKQRKIVEENFAQEQEQLRQRLMEQQLKCQKVNRLVSQLLLVVDPDVEDEGHFVFEDDDLETLQSKGKLLQETVEEARHYMASLKTRIGRDHTLSVPDVKRKQSRGLDISEELDGIEISLPDMDLPIVSAMDDDDGHFMPTLLKHSCMLLFAAAGITFAPKTFTTWTTSLFAPSGFAKATRTK